MMDDTDLEPINTPSGSTSLGDEESGGGPYEEGIEDEDEDLYYIPERRPSLDLGPAPMDTSHWYYVEQANSPILGYGSMASEAKSDTMEEDETSSTRIQLERTGSYSSCYSLDSDDCEKKIPKVRSKEDTVTEPPDRIQLIEDPNEIKHPSVTVGFTLRAICSTLGKMTQGDFRRFKRMLWKHFPQVYNTPPESMDMLDLADRLLEVYSLTLALQLTRKLLEEMGRKKIVEYLETLCVRNEVHYDLCETLKKKYGEVHEDLNKKGEMRPVDDVYNRLYITKTSDNGPNIEHEVMKIEKQDSNRDPGKELDIKDLMCEEWLEESNIKFLLITGIAGSGKSMAIRKLILEWIQGKSHQHVNFLFPLPFRELTQFEGVKISLLQIIETLYPETKKLRDDDFRCEDCKMLFVFDGLDEYSGKLDFENTELLGDHTDVTTLNVIVVNLLRGRLLYRGMFMVTSRPQVRRCIPWDTHYDERDLRGFREDDKDTYFMKRFKNPDDAARVIAYTKSLKTIRIMCHLPMFCSLVADEYEQMHAKREELPNSITYMYTKLMLALLGPYRGDRAPELGPEKEKEFLMKLGKLALNMLEQNKFKVTRSDWREVGVSDEEAVVNSGLCNQYVTKPYVLFQEKVISFIHPTMQEYLAALYVFLSFRNQGKNIFEQQLKDKFSRMFKGNKMMELYKCAVDKSLLYEDGKLDIFLRFLFGMARNINMELLKPFCNSAMKWPSAREDATALVKKRIKENQNPQRNENLKRCLEELGVGAREVASL